VQVSKNDDYSIGKMKNQQVYQLQGEKISCLNKNAFFPTGVSGSLYQNNFLKKCTFEQMTNLVGFKSSADCL
jgi:hypothetical protein